MSVGGAFCHPKLVHFMTENFKIPTMQGYGMTETSPMISLNSISMNRIGSVGKPMSNMDVSFSKSDNEISVRGHNVMMGYLRDINTANGDIEIDAQGEWFNTGDTGYLDDDGFLFINGRTKTMYKLSNGKYVNPSYIESILCMSPLIEQAVVFGDGLSYNQVIVHSSQEKDMDVLLCNIRESLQGKVQPYEIPKEIILADEPFTLQNGLLTQKLEPNRRKILDKYVSS
jgi:long-chain acyl-CoA synthetase